MKIAIAFLFDIMGNMAIYITYPLSKYEKQKIQQQIVKVCRSMLLGTVCGRKYFTLTSDEYRPNLINHIFLEKHIYVVKKSIFF